MIMVPASPVLTRRGLLAIAAAASAVGNIFRAAPSYAQAVAAAGDDTIRPFHINVPEDALVDLRRRIAATRWPDKETVTDESQGIRLAEMQELVDYWGTRLQLAQRRSEVECAAGVRDHNRRRGHPVHPRAFT
jgi:Epoxide hydrolase N terminus